MNKGEKRVTIIGVGLGEEEKKGDCRRMLNELEGRGIKEQGIEGEKRRKWGKVCDNSKYPNF